MFNNNDHRQTTGGSIHYRVYATGLRSLEGAGWSDHETEAEAQEVFDAACEDRVIKHAVLSLVTESVLSTHSKS